MARQFFPATAEQVVSVVSAVAAMDKAVDKTFVSEFCDLTEEQAEKALMLATDLGFLKRNAKQFEVLSPLSRLLRTPRDIEKAAVLRIVLESYQPFLIFREQIEIMGSAPDAAKATKAVLDIDAHREELKDALLSLATYSGALIPASGGSYTRDRDGLPNLLRELAQGSSEQSASVHRIRKELGAAAGRVSAENVVDPLATALRHAGIPNAREAVLNAGNAVETFLDEFAARQGVSLTGATGINAKLDKLSAAKVLPKKLIYVGKYLGHVRNAADHGNDAEVNSPWNVRDSTGINYVFVACSFIASTVASEAKAFEI
jgi:hypothetical protein